MSMTRTRFTRAPRVWARFRAAIAEKVGLTIRRAIPGGGDDGVMFKEHR
jgi:hypothetical protein